MPELAALDVREVASRAVTDHTRRTGMSVELDAGNATGDVALPIKIALYRALQELLSNAYRHGGGAGVRVRVDEDDQFVGIEVADRGRGFDVTELASEPGLGLAGMREQAQLLGGDFGIRSTSGAGTTVHVRWPMPRGRKTPTSAHTGGGT